MKWGPTRGKKSYSPTYANTNRSPRRDVRYQRARAQHGPAASEHAWRAAGRVTPRWRKSGRRRRRDWLSPPRHREAVREPHLDADHPAHRPDGLRRGGHQQRRLLRNSGKADVARGSAPCPVRAHHPLRAPAHREPLSLDRHARDGHRRDDGVPLRVPRARAHPGFVRGVLRRAAHLQLDAHRRPAARHSAGLPEGPIVGKVPRLIKPPAGETYHAIESPKGELGYFIVSDGKSTNPYRFRVRPPSFCNLQGLRRLVKGHLVADVVALIGSLDIVLGEVDR